MRKAMVPVVLVILIIALSFTACDDFFSSGWGSPRDYRVGNINVTANNLDNWLDRTLGNQPLAMRVSEAILIRLNNPPPLSEEHRARFQRAGIRIAVEASGLGTALLNNAFGLLADMADFEGLGYDKLKEILGGIQGSLRGSGSAAAESIASMVAMDIDTSSGVPTFPSSSFVHQANPSEVAKTIMVLTLAETEHERLDISQGDWEYFCLEAFGLDLNPEGKVVVAYDNMSPRPTTLALAAYLNLIAGENFDSRNNFLIEAIRSGFFGNNQSQNP